MDRNIARFLDLLVEPCSAEHNFTFVPLHRLPAVWFAEDAPKRENPSEILGRKDWIGNDMSSSASDARKTDFPFPGISEAMDGTTAIVTMETTGSEAAGAYPITPASAMGEGWAVAMAAGRINAFGNRLIFFEPEGEHAAAGVTAGMSMVGLRSANFSAGQGIAYMHESLYAAVGKRLTYVLNISARAMTKQSLNIHAGHDDYHAVDDTGFFQMFAKDVQEAADVNLLAHRIAELSLNPGICAMDGFLTSHVIETLMLPERELVARFLGSPDDVIESPTPAQRMLFGETRRRIPELFDFDNPAQLGTVQNQDAYAQGVAAQRPFFFDHIEALADQAMEEYYQLTGRRFHRATGYRTDGAEAVFVAQGSIVSNLEAVVDHLRDDRGLPVGLINMTMFRPFPADQISKLLKGKRAATVLERLDQPLAVDPPMLREIRATMSKALENGRAGKGDVPHPGVEACILDDVPEFYSGSFGMGSRDTQPGDLIAAAENMLAKGKARRRFYLGVDFIRKNTPLPALAAHQDEIEKLYPGIGGLALERAENVNLLPKGALSLRMHSIGGWGAITTGKNMALTLFSLLGMHVKANPKYGSEKKGQPTTFFATFARQPLRLNCQLSQVDVVLSPDPNVFSHSNPLTGLIDGGAFVIQSDLTPEELWANLPGYAHRTIREQGIRVFYMDAFAVAREEASDPNLEFRMQGAVFQGAFFRAAPLMEREGLSEEDLFGAIKDQLQEKFGSKGQKIVDDNYRVIRRGFDELLELDTAAMEAAHRGGEKLPEMPHQFKILPTFTGVADRRRFFDQVGATYAHGEEPIADPFASLSAVPAVTGALRDMTAIRFEVPKFVPEKCTGCGQCWIQCPDTAIPGLVSELQPLLETALTVATNGASTEAVSPRLRDLSTRLREVLKDTKFTTFSDALIVAGQRLAGTLEAADADAVTSAVKAMAGAMADFPLTKCVPFFDVPENREAGSGGLLSVTINPETCKGCMLCVDVCPDEALIPVHQGTEEIERLRANHKIWERLPDTPEKYVNVTDLDEGIGVLGTLLLKRKVYNSMAGGDGACMGCGEKTVMHMVTSAIEASLAPRVKAFIEKLRDLIKGLDHRARLLLAEGADLGDWPELGAERVELPVSEETRQRVVRITGLIKQLEELLKRYTEGAGRASCGITNATGCSSVWGSTYPFNPYPYPWVNHLFQDAPSIAIGVFEGFMRKMEGNFETVRRAEMEINDAYDPAVHEKFFEEWDWRDFSNDEFRLCPPVVAIGGDGAMLDIGFQNLSRLLVSGKPIRVVVLDTQVYSNTGGQACTSGFFGQVADMSEYGRAQHGKIETRKELSLIGIAHREAYVLQSSQASAPHLIGGVLKGLAANRPALFILHSPCMPEHGITDDAAAQAAKLALESRAMPFLIYDPDAGEGLSECLDLTGNPAMDEKWPTYELTYVDDDDQEQTMELPMTTVDWAATEKRFSKHFKKAKKSTWTDNMVAIGDYLELSAEERAEAVPFVHVMETDKHLGRLTLAPEMVVLAEDCQSLWKLLTEMAGITVSDAARDVVTGELEDEFDRRIAALTAAHKAAITEMTTTYPELVAQRMSDALLGIASGAADPVPALLGTTAAVAPVASPAGAAAAPAEDEDDALLDGPWIDQALCTTCDDCINLNKKLFGYNADKKAEILDPKAGSYQELVLAAERCPARCIHPGDPLNKRERGLDKWVKRAQPFL